MKPWPEGLINVEDAIRPLLDVARTLYVLHRTHANHADYTGYELTLPLTATQEQPDKTFSEDGLAHHLEQGREPLEVILGVAFQLGFLQGQRAEMAYNAVVIELLESTLVLLKK